MLEATNVWVRWAFGPPVRAPRGVSHNGKQAGAESGFKLDANSEVNLGAHARPPSLLMPQAADSRREHPEVLSPDLSSVYSSIHASEVLWDEETMEGLRRNYPAHPSRSTPWPLGVMIHEQHLMARGKGTSSKIYTASVDPDESQPFSTLPARGSTGSIVLDISHPRYSCWPTTRTLSSFFRTSQYTSALPLPDCPSSSLFQSLKAEYPDQAQSSSSACVLLTTF